MGAAQSVEQKIAYFAKKNDHLSLKETLSELQRRDAHWETNKRRYLEDTSAAGVTPLVLAAQRGNLQCVEVLLSAGADPHAVCPSADGNSALHEAVDKRQDVVVNVLLQAGANPCVENARGFTAMDIACARKNPTILRLLEQRCPFKGWLYIKTSTFAGLSREWKRRWCVICHRFPYPRGPSTQRLIHVVLLAYKDTSAVIPVCRVWLDGASAVPMQSSSTQNRPEGVGPTQAALKLHPKHELPAGAYTTGYPGHGLTMYLRPDFGGQPSLDAFQAFITLVNNRGMLPGGPSATAGWRPQGAGGAYTPAGPLSDEELARRLQAEEDSAFAAHLASHPELVPPGGANPASGPAPPASSPASFAGAYPAIDFGQRHDEGRASSYPGTPIQGSAGSSAGRPRPPPPAGPLAQSALVSSGSGGGGGTASTTPEATTSATPPPAAPLLINVENSPPRPQTQVRPGEWWAAFPPVEPVLPSSNPSATQSSPSTAPPPASTAAVGSPIASSASTIPVSATVPSGTTSEAVNSGAVDDDEGICVICLEEPATAGFLHGDSVHRCCCKSCAQHLKDSNVRTCPMCRQSIQGYIMHVY